jgi:hypothetical protein
MSEEQPPLKHCPFCGEQPAVNGTDVQCPTHGCFACEGTGFFYESEQDAIWAWNTRQLPQITDIVRQCLIDWMIQALRDISEDTHAAGWYSDIEHFVWDTMNGKKTPCYEWSNTQRAFRRLAEVSDLLDVWVRWDEEKGEPVPVEIGVWEHLHKAWCERQQ